MAIKLYSNISHYETFLQTLPIGVKEYWSIGFLTITPPLHYSIRLIFWSGFQISPDLLLCPQRQFNGKNGPPGFIIFNPNMAVMI